MGKFVVANYFKVYAIDDKLEGWVVRNKSRVFAELPATRPGFDTSCVKSKSKQASRNSLDSSWFPCLAVPVCQLILGKLKSPNSRTSAFGWAVHGERVQHVVVSFFEKSGLAFGGRRQAKTFEAKPDKAATVFLC